jgi:hypothetical protein
MQRSSTWLHIYNNSLGNTEMMINVKVCTQMTFVNMNHPLTHLQTHPTK